MAIKTEVAKFRRPAGALFQCVAFSSGTNLANEILQVVKKVLSYFSRFCRFNYICTVSKYSQRGQNIIIHVRNWPIYIHHAHRNNTGASIVLMHTAQLPATRLRAC